jgi:hypothetical protein
MVDPMMGLEPARSRRSDFLKAAERDRLVRTATADAPRLADRVLLRAGDTLVGAGLRLYAWQQLRRFRRHAARLAHLT